jgi:hypothetical protein
MEAEGNHSLVDYFRIIVYIRPRLTKYIEPVSKGIVLC